MTSFEKTAQFYATSVGAALLGCALAPDGYEWWGVGAGMLLAFWMYRRTLWKDMNK